MTDDEIREDMKRMAGNHPSIHPESSFKSSIFLDPTTKYIFDVPSYVELLIPILRADGQAIFFYK
jgi:hypothetical protein